MNSLQKKKFLQLLFFVLFSLVLFALLLVSIFHSSSEELTEVDTFAESLLSEKSGNLNKKTMNDLKKQWSKFSPNTRKRLAVAVIRQRLLKLKKEMEPLTQEAKEDKIKQMLIKMRKRHLKMTEKKKSKLRKLYSSKDGKDVVKKMGDFYRTDISAKERAYLDPLVHEWISEMNQVLDSEK